MNKLVPLIYAVFLLWTFLGVVEGAYPVNINDAAIRYSPRLHGRSTVVYENKMYVYGGKTVSPSPPTNKMYVYDFETDPEGARMSLVEQKNPGPICFFCGAVMIDNGTRMMILTENIDGVNFRDSNNNNSIVQPYIFDFKTSTWTIDNRPPVLNEALRDVFKIRYLHSTVLGADGLIYTIGGADYYSNEIAETSWYYNPVDNSYGTIANYNMEVYPVVGHNAFVLS